MWRKGGDYETCCSDKCTFFVVIFCFPQSGKAIEITDTLLLEAKIIEGEPFGITGAPHTFYAYFSYDDALLLVDGTYRNQLSNFELTIGATQWAFNDILDHSIAVESGKVVDFFLDVIPSAIGSDKRISISNVASDIQWRAVDAYTRPTPELTGSYSIAQGRIVAETAPVPEPSTLLLFGAGLAGFAGLSRRK